GAAVEGGAVGQAQVKGPKGLVAKFNGEERCSRRSNHGGVIHARWVENRRQRPHFVELATIAFEVVAVKNDGDIGQFVLVPRDGTRTRLAKFGKQNVAGVQARLDGGVEFSSAQNFSWIGGRRHDGSDGGNRQLSP